MPIAKTHLVNLDRSSRIAATEIQHVVPGDLVEIVGTSQHAVVALRLTENDLIVGPFAVVPDASGDGWTARIGATQLLADGDFREWVVELQDKVTDPLPTATAVYRTESQSSVWRRAGFLKVANRRVTKASWSFLAIGGFFGAISLSIVLPQWSAHSVGARILMCLFVALAVLPLAWRLSIRKSIRSLRVAGRASFGCIPLVLAAQFFASYSTVYVHVRAQSSVAQVHFGTALSRRTFTRFELDRLRPALLAANTDVIAVTQADRCETIGDSVETGSSMFLLVCRNRWLHVRPVRRRELGIDPARVHGEDCVDLTGPSCRSFFEEPPQSTRLQRADQREERMGNRFDWHPSVHGTLTVSPFDAQIAHPPVDFQTEYHVHTWGPRQIGAIETVGTSPPMRWVMSPAPASVQMLTTEFSIHPIETGEPRSFRVRVDNGESIRVDCTRDARNIGLLSVDSALVAAVKLGSSLRMPVAEGQSTVALCSWTKLDDVIFYLRRPGLVHGAAIGKDGAWSQRMFVPQGTHTVSFRADISVNGDPAAFEEDGLAHPWLEGGSHRMQPDTFATLLDAQVGIQPRNPSPRTRGVPAYALFPWIWVQVQWPGRHWNFVYAPYDNPHRTENLLIEDGQISGINVH